VANPLVFVDDLRAPVLADGDDHHLRRVLRLRDGAEITIADGRGSWCTATLGRDVVPTSTVADEPVEAPEVAVAFAIVKGDRPELIVQKLTELGVDTIVPFVASRSVVRWDADRAERNVERMRRVAREAAMQCRRARLPLVEPLAEFATVVARPGAAIADMGGAAPTLAHPLLLVGPEGGWTDAERASASQRVSLATYVLRAETAAVVAGSLLTALRGGITSVSPSSPASEPTG
jgi:16S rRNA (uracil1498-N3)-methyltransferase